MNKFILLFFVFCCLGFYELSGGSQFDPASARQSAINARLDRYAARIATRTAPVFTQAQVETSDNRSDVVPSPSNRATQNSLNLVSFASVVDPAPAPAPAPVPQPLAAIQPTAPLEEVTRLAATEAAPLSIASLEEESAGGVAFAGNSVSASSIVPSPDPDIRTIKGTLVNMRSGPGTDYDVVDQLSQNTRVEILTNTGNGWVELRPLPGGTTGWIAEFLLTSG
ncbi:MAG: SH3 domain-containing protein [Roseobacter sp.]